MYFDTKNTYCKSEDNKSFKISKKVLLNLLSDIYQRIYYYDEF